MKLRRPILKLISSSQFIVAAVLLLLLPLLAALQYRWLGQLSEGERDQKKAHLRTLAARFGQDFDQEITRTYISFLPIGEAAGMDWMSAYVANYDHWTKSSSYPALIKNVFVAMADEREQLHLRRLNHETKSFEDSDWPPAMAALHRRLEERPRGFGPPPSQERPRDQREPGPPSPDQPGPPGQAGAFMRLMSPFYDDPPAMAMMLFEPGRMRDDKSFTPPYLAGFAIIEFDLRYIQQEILPALAHRHFVAGDGSSYDLTIVSQDNQRVIYQSGNQVGSQAGLPAGLATATPASASNADASAALFGLRVDEMRDLMRNHWRRDEIRDAFKRNRKPGSGPPVFGAREMMEREPTSLWQMYIRHRAGSLEAAVASVRRRNLLISFSILALLAASVALMMLSSRRAHRLAQQQMDFVAGISHELRTPLAVIESAAYNLDKGVVKDPKQIKSYGRLIRKETGRLTEMIEQVLEFAGVQSGRQRYDLLPVSLNHLIDEVLTASQPLFIEGDFQIEANVAPDLPTVMAESAAIARAIQNLLNNAMKYSGESRWIGLYAGAHSNGSKQFVQITVKDRGLGIPDEELPHIFEPFYRGSEARSAQIRGNGLGLSLVKNIMAAHEGQITVKSKPGEGSSFTVSLPVMAEAARVSDLKTTAEIELSARLPDARS